MRPSNCPVMRSQSLLAIDPGAGVSFNPPSLEIDPQGSDAAHSWKETAVKTSLRYFSVAQS
jgi:hypothetical protein